MGFETVWIRGQRPSPEGELLLFTNEGPLIGDVRLSLTRDDLTTQTIHVQPNGFGVLDLSPTGSQNWTVEIEFEARPDVAEIDWIN